MADFEPTGPRPPRGEGQVTPPAAPMPAPDAAWLPDPWNAAQQRFWDGRAWTEHTAPNPAAVVAPYHQQPVMQPHGSYAPVQPYGYAGPTTVVMSDANPNGLHITIAWIFAILTLGYLLPWAVAATRGKSNALAIGLLNFLLGWTFLGWVAALVMACGSHQSYAVVR